MATNYVPGYGYVSSDDPGTRGSVRPLTGSNQASRPQRRAAAANTATVASSGRESVYDWIEGLFSGLGDPALGTAVRNVLTGSKSSADAITKIRALPEYAARFPGNAARIKAGLSPIEESAYLSQERSYRQVLSYYGLPKGFYDDPKSDFADWIANDVSPDEINERAGMAARLAANADPNVKQALQQFYGLSDGDLTAYFLDRKRTTTILEKQIKTAEIGAEVLRSDVMRGNRKFAEGLADAGVTAMQARGALADVADEQDTVEMLGNIEGSRVKAGDQVEAKLGLDSEADKAVRGLKSRERARFGGSGAGTRALGSGDAAGSF